MRSLLSEETLPAFFLYHIQHTGSTAACLPCVAWYTTLLVVHCNKLTHSALLVASFYSVYAHFVMCTCVSLLLLKYLCCYFWWWRLHVNSSHHPSKYVDQAGQSGLQPTLTCVTNLLPYQRIVMSTI